MSIILKGLTHFFLQITLLLSILFLLRGHHHPGGGFVGSLIATTGIGLYILSYQYPPTFISRYYKQFIILGISCLLISLFIGLINAHPLLTAVWISLGSKSMTIKLGSPLLFDLGIYLIIVTSMTLILSALEITKDD